MLCRYLKLLVLACERSYVCKRVAMPSPLVALLNLFKVYCILIDAEQCVLYSIIYATTNTPLILS